MNKIDDFLRNVGYYTIAGVDEAGRGALAGPVVAACVALDYNNVPNGIKDSKKLTAARREELAEKIKASAICYSYGIMSALLIDKLNILESTRLAMRTAIDGVYSEMHLQYVMIDAVTISNLDVPTISFVHGEDKSVAVAAASILAKVLRDQLMDFCGKQYREYGFSKNKGYPTRDHIKALLKYGPCAIHRRSYKPVREACDNGSQLVSKASGRGSGLEVQILPPPNKEL